MKIVCVFVLSGMLIFAANQKNGLQSSDLQKKCQPCMAYFVWGYDDSEENLRVQKHFLSRVMDTLTIGSNIKVRACGNTVTQFIKNNSESVLENFAAVNFVLSKENIMSYISLKKDISGYIQQKPKNESFELFFFVNENTMIDKSRTAIEELKKHKVFVAYHGPAPVPYYWKSLATDEQHMLHLKHNIEDDFVDVLNVMCHDSRLYCDNDMYWNGSDCFTCSYICTQTPSEFCKKECPYFNPFYLEDKLLEENNCLHFYKNINMNVIVFGLVNIAISAIFMIIVCLVSDCSQDKKGANTEPKEVNIQGPSSETTRHMNKRNKSNNVQLENIDIQNGKTARRRNRNQSAAALYATDMQPERH